MTTAVEAIDVVVGYDATPVADVGSFTVHADRLTVITGPNGSGKTTLLKTLAGLLPPISGRIVPQLPPGAGGVVFVHSTPYLFAGTVRHNVRLSWRGDERRAAMRCARSVLSSCGTRTSGGSPLESVSGSRLPAPWQRSRGYWSSTNPKAVWTRRGPAVGAGSWSRRLFAGHPSIVIATHQLSALEGLLMNVVSLPQDKS